MATKRTQSAAKAGATKTRVSQSALAKAEAAKITALAKELGVDTALTTAQKHAYVGGTSVSDKFLELGARAQDDMGASLAVAGFTADGARTAIAANAAQGATIGAANALVRGLEERRLAIYGTAGALALTVYAQLKVMSRGTNGDPRAKAHLKAMSDESKAYRLESRARNAAAKAAFAAKRATHKAAKEAAAAARKSAKKPPAQSGATGAK